MEATLANLVEPGDAPADVFGRELDFLEALHDRALDRLGVGEVARDARGGGRPDYCRGWLWYG